MSAEKSRMSLFQLGYTLLEMTIVVAILAVAAAIAVPSDFASRHQTLDLAASQAADALRFARAEARRTGFVHGVFADVPNDRLRVFRLDEIPNPNLKVFDVYQPVSKQLFTVDFGATPYRGVSISSVSGQFVGSCDDPANVSFDAFGVVRCFEPLATRILDVEVELSLGPLTKTVVIDSHTGRVSIQ